MIENVPNAEELREVSLRLYFKAWSDVVDILLDWTRIMAAQVPDWVEQSATYELTEADVFSEEWLEYLERAQGDLQGIYTLIQQSQEIGLKAQICDISRFLLLRRPDQRPEPIRPDTWDFTDFATIEAQHLPKTHDTFRRPLSKEFIHSYEQLRRSRNKIAHLGIYRDRIAPHRIISLLQQQFDELYPKRRWFDDRERNFSNHRWADVGDASDLAILHTELDDILPILSKGQYRWLMGQEPNVQRFYCHDCYDRGGFESSDLPQIKTAYRQSNGVRCAVCTQVTPARPGCCWDPSCKGGMMSDVPNKDSRCLICDYSAKEWAERVADEASQSDHRRFKLPGFLANIDDDDPF
jgi:hypothetical protein